MIYSRTRTSPSQFGCPTIRKKAAIIKFLMIVLVTVLTQVSLFAQEDEYPPNNNQVKFPLSPNAASFIRVEDFQVNYQTGNVNISIPLTEVQSRVIKFPISISYNSTGIRVNDESSSIGLGWNLQAGGVITRSVMGIPDEEGWISGGSSGTYDDIRNAVDYDLSDSVDYMEAKNIYLGYYDTQPDLYNFNFPGYSGSFRIGNDGKAYSEVLDILSVEIPSANLFEITASNGTLYRFGTDLKNNRYVEKTTIEPDFFYGASITNSAYYLTEIISPSKEDTVYFSYTPSVYSHYRINNQNIDYLISVDPSNLLSPTIGTTNYTTSGSSVIINTYDLSEIRFSTGKVKFNYDSDRLDTYSQRLMSIEVYKIDKTGTTLKKSIEFDNNDKYFSRTSGIPFIPANHSTKDKVSLKLEGVKLKDSSQNLIETYSFNYNTTALPARETTALDFWGYYNGELTNSDLIPTTTFVDIYGTHYFGNADRSSDEIYMKACILEEIVYPTGGSVEFDFESNISLIDGVSTTVGGLRIKEIAKYDGNDTNPIEIRTFKYNESSTNPGVGTMVFPHLNNNTRYATDWNKRGPELDDPVIIERKFVVSSNSFEDYGFNNGSPVEYGCVTEYLGTLTNNIGKREYYYSPTQFRVWLTGSSDEPYNTVVYPKYLSGNLLKVYDYSNSLGSYVLIGKTEYDYSVIRTDSIKALKSFNRITPINYSDEDSFYKHLFYDIYNYYVVVGKRAKTSETTTQYDVNGNNPIIIQKSFDFDATSLQLKELSYPDSNNITRKTEYKYPTDRLSISGIGQDEIDVLESMEDQGWIEEPIEIKEYQNTTLISTIRKDYFENDSGIVQLAKVSQSFGSQSQLDLQTEFTHFDSGSNRLVQYLNHINGISTYVLWGYNNTYPTAKIICPDYTEIVTNQTSVSNDFSSVSTDPTEGTALSNFIIRFGQNVDLTLSNLTDYNNPALPDFNISMVIKDAISGITITTLSFNSSVLNGKVFLEPSTYKIDYIKDANTSYNCTFQYISEARSAQGLFESFEEDPTSVDIGRSKSGSKALLGTYLLPLSNIDEGNYTLSYWLSQNGTDWTYSESSISITSESISTQIGSTGQYLDEIRVRPPNSFMTTYTYEPLVGVTSETDPNGVTTYYEYDTYGRLKHILDNDGNILKAYKYNFAGSGN